MKLHAAIERFLASPGLSNATRRSYRFDLEPFAAWLASRGLMLEDVDASVHHKGVHGPFDEVPRQEDRDRDEPFPCDAAEMTGAVPQPCNAGRVHDGDVQQAVVQRTDLAHVLLTKLALTIGHHVAAPELY